MATRSRFALFFSAILAISGCFADAEGYRATPIGSGPQVRWELERRPLPEIPFPNDVATSVDVNSPTGRRINASSDAPTRFERSMRERLATLDGFGTFAPITVSFDKPIDVEALLEKQGGSQFAAFEMREHAVYLVNLTTGLPVPLDIDSGARPTGLQQTSSFGPNDPHAGEGQLLWETFDEDTNRDGVLDVGEDRDFDGVLDVPNTLNGRLSSAPNAAYDEILSFWERETNTLLLRPIVPLDPATTYAVVLTDRLVGTDGRPVRSPFPDVHHLGQRAALAPLRAHFEEHRDVFGDLARRGWEGVAFAWTFTTQSARRDLEELRAGLLGEGTFAKLAADFPPDVLAARVQDDDGECATNEARDRPYIATRAQMQEVARAVAGVAFGLGPDAIEELVRSFDSIEHFALVFVNSPYLLGDPAAPSLDETFQVDLARGTVRATNVRVPFLIAVPRETAVHAQPFPVAFYVHSYSGTHLEALGFAGSMAHQGIATAAAVLPGHGLGVDDGLATLMRALFGQSCLGRFGDGLGTDRVRDWTGDNVPDSGGDFWTGYVFHTRDMIRQSVLELVQGVRAFRSFDGFALAQGGSVPASRSRFRDPEGDGDFDLDGAPNLAGDFDADGRVDVGGPFVPYFVWGQSLGAVVAAVAGGVETRFEAAAPTSGAGGLSDMSPRSTESMVRAAVTMRLLGPLVTSEPPSSYSDRTACAEGERSIRVHGTVGNEFPSVEVACASATEVQDGDAVLLVNLTNGQVRCDAVRDGGRFRVGFPADTGDLLQLEVYRGAASELDGATCEFAEGAELSTSFVVSSVESGVSSCAKCGRFGGARLEVGDAFRSPTTGLGLRRQSPELRRMLGIAQIALEPADPINYARRYFLEPLPGTSPRSLLVLTALGDTTVPVSGAHHLARAAGILHFASYDAADAYIDYRAPLDFVRRYDGEHSASDLLAHRFVTEAQADRARVPTTFGNDWLVDPDDLSEGRQRFLDRNGTPAPSQSEGFASPSLATPLRLVRASRAATSPLDPVFAPTPQDALSGLLHFMVRPKGDHGFDPAEPSKTWDESVYLGNLIGWYFASRAAELQYFSDPANHLCLEQNECVFGQQP